MIKAPSGSSLRLDVAESNHLCANENQEPRVFCHQSKWRHTCLDSSLSSLFYRRRHIVTSMSSSPSLASSYPIDHRSCVPRRPHSHSSAPSSPRITETYIKRIQAKPVCLTALTAAAVDLGVVAGTSNVLTFFPSHSQGSSIPWPTHFPKHALFVPHTHMRMHLCPHSFPFTH